MARFDEWDRIMRDEDPSGGFRGAPPPPPPPPGPDDGSYGSRPPDDGSGVPSPDVIPDDVGRYQPPSYGGPMRPDFGPVPTPPQLRLDPFSAPTMESAQNEPGYQFGLSSGQNSIDRSAAARGVLRSGNTLTDLVEYGQNFGQQFYTNMYDRALQAYDRYAQGEMAKFSPQMQHYQNMFGQNQAAGMAEFDWLGRLFGYDWEGSQRNEDRIMQTMMGTPPPPPPQYQ